MILIWLLLSIVFIFFSPNIFQGLRNLEESPDEREERVREELKERNKDLII